MGGLGPTATGTMARVRAARVLWCHGGSLLAMEYGKRWDFVKVPGSRIENDRGKQLTPRPVPPGTWPKASNGPRIQSFIDGPSIRLPEMSNFCCLPGRAGGTPIIV